MKVFSNLAISLDGKIADLSQAGKMLGTPHDKKLMSQLRIEADVVLTGATTLKTSPHTYRAKTNHLSLKQKKTFRPAANAIVTASGKIDPDLKFWSDPQVVRFVFTTSSGFQNALKSARERAFVIVCGDGPAVDLNLVLSRLKESGLNNVLIEGGGETMASFLKAGLLHEINLTLTPWVLGGRNNPTLVGGDTTLEPWKSLSLVKMKRIKNEVFFKYKVNGARRV